VSADKHKPCGCLTDGYNWLNECETHRQTRKQRNELLAVVRMIVKWDGPGGTDSPMAVAARAALARAEEA
jgi:hypothetical protein